ncbi:protein toll-like [Cylas formicarius]|uniref:protein toll-like n=1 Tax=Cylas formicarius TaxID=197179 RepID=UPI0029583CCC|nr:protein toll-like [Cylas formicarius]
MKLLNGLALISIASLVGISVQSPSGCIKTDTCSCYSAIGGVYEFQCPDVHYEINIQWTPGRTVDMFCETRENRGIFNESIFPTFDGHDVPSITIKYCPNISAVIKTARRKFNMVHLRQLSIETSADNSLKVTSDYLEGLDSLERLKIKHNSLILSKDFLKYVPNLVGLNLYKNKLKDLNIDFKYVPKLKSLDASGNEITSLFDGGFEGLGELTNLYLWNNNLSVLRKDMFRGLTGVKLLELSSNLIETVEPDTFSELLDITILSLLNNRIKFLHSNTFKNNALLQQIKIAFNPIFLPDYIFANLSKLKVVRMDSCGLQSIPDHTFTGSVNLSEIQLSNNSLTTIPKTLFDGLDSLMKLDLSQNRLTSIPDEAFYNLRKLKELHLEKNELTVLGADVFLGLENLQKLILSRNKIARIETTSFRDLLELRHLDLSHNRWDMVPDRITGVTALGFCVKIEEVLLHHNKVETIPENFFDLMVNIKKFNVSYNDISNVRVPMFIKASSFEMIVDVSHNNITEVDFSFIEVIARANYNGSLYEPYHASQTILILSDNVIPCDCTNYNLVKYNNDMYDPEVRALVDIKQDRLYCSNFESPILARDLRPRHITCSLEGLINCPGPCSCDYRPYDLSIIVDCSYRNLSTYPTLNITGITYIQTVLYLNGNHFSQGPTTNSSYHNVTVLDLSRNHINEMTWIPPRIKELRLSGNNLTGLNENFIKLLNKTASLRRMTLNSNPWYCDCYAANLQNYLMAHFDKVNRTDVQCYASAAYLVKLNIVDLCPNPLYLTVALSLIPAILFFFAVAIALYYRYQKEIKVYLYAKNLCLWFVTEEELDKDKTYDVFISYAHQDEKFVVEHLLPELEHGDHRFKVCIHYRDFIPGELISTQVVSTVKNSRRTLVVLSNNFLDSVWGRMEFRMAHTEAISEGRARVIVVICGDLDESKLDDEMKCYLKTNTYVKWGDRYFWSKLKYALPHSSKYFYDKEAC